MRRPLVVIGLLLAILPALADDADSYVNARYGFELGVPAGFRPSERAPDNADGRAFRNDAGTQHLTAWGGQIVEADFTAHAEAAIRLASESGWRITYRAVTPGWASYSGSRNGLVLYGRDIALCAGTAYASFHITYPERDIGRMNAVVERLAASLRARAGSC